MAQIRVTKIRGYLATLAAIVLIILLASAAVGVLDMNVPVLSDIANVMGL